MWKIIRVVIAALFLQFLFPTLMQITNWDFLKAYHSWLWFAMFWYATAELVRIDGVQKRIKKWAGSRSKKVSYAVAAAVSVIVGLAYWHFAIVLARESPKAVPSESGQPPKLPTEQPVIETSYELGKSFVPIPVGPKTTVRMVLINQNREALLFELKNNDRKILFWPKDFPPECSYPVGVLRVSNRGKVDVYDAIVSFTLLIGGDNLPEGLARVPFDLPPISLPAGGEPAQFLVVNQSPLGGLIQFSQDATMQARGETERRRIKVGHKILGPNNFPALVQSTYDWRKGKCREPAKGTSKQ